jgi:hypothetical protein
MCTSTPLRSPHTASKGAPRVFGNRGKPRLSGVPISQRSPPWCPVARGGVLTLSAAMLLWRFPWHPESPNISGDHLEREKRAGARDHLVPAPCGAWSQQRHTCDRHLPSRIGCGTDATANRGLHGDVRLHLCVSMGCASLKAVLVFMGSGVLPGAVMMREG